MLILHPQCVIHTADEFDILFWVKWVKPSSPSLMRAKLEVPTQICTPNVISKVTPMRGGTGPCPSPLMRHRRPLRLFGALQSRQCVYRENVVGGRPPTTEGPSEKYLYVFTRKMWLEGAAPSNDEKSLQKVPPMTTVRRPPWVKWHPPSLAPFAIFLNTLQTLGLA